MRLPRVVAGALAVALLLPVPAQAGLAEDLARCQNTVWPRFAGWSLARQQGPDSPRTPDDFYCLALGYWSGQGPFQGKDPVKAAGLRADRGRAESRGRAGAAGLLPEPRASA